MHKAYKVTRKSTYTDIWGYEFDWLDPEDGWTNIRRRAMPDIDKLTRYQPKTLPAFTKLGYKKTKMPKKLYELIKNAKETRAFVVPEKCEENWPMYNCVRIREDGSKGIKSHWVCFFLTQISQISHYSQVPTLIKSHDYIRVEKQYNLVRHRKATSTSP